MLTRACARSLVRLGRIAHQPLRHVARFHSAAPRQDAPKQDALKQVAPKQVAPKQAEQVEQVEQAEQVEQVEDKKAKAKKAKAKRSKAAKAAKQARAAKLAEASSVSIRGRSYDIDPSWFNVPLNVLDATSRRLHLQRDHPIAITCQIIQSHFPAPTFKHYNQLDPVVSTHQNFDSLGFAADHASRTLTDTYYINNTTLLRTHTSAHQADTFRANESEGYLISADVYRRDEIDRNHYPVFHQMEGARSWDRTKVPDGDVAAAVRKDFETLPCHGVQVEDPNPPFHPERNPLQDGHSPDEAEAIGNHLKRSLENMVVDVFSRTKAAASQADPDYVDEPLRMRWVEAFFPFTSPSWELQVYYSGDWLEVLGAGVVKQDLYTDAGVPSQLGWAFGLGLERIAMLLFKIPDIRLFWSRDKRFLSQFYGVLDRPDTLKRFVPFSKYPPCPRDVSFWLPAAPGESSAAVPEQSSAAAPEQSSAAAPEESSAATPEESSVAAPEESSAAAPEESSAAAPEESEDSSAAAPEQSEESSAAAPEESSAAAPKESEESSAAAGTAKGAFHENDLMEVVRSVGGNDVDRVELIDEFTDPQTGRKSMTYRIVYGRLGRTLSHVEANRLHERVTAALVSELGVEHRGRRLKIR